MAWGRGLHITPAKGPIKREGDHRSPAGVYALDTAFGAASELPPTSRGFPYAQMHATSYCVEDQRSEHYNQLIDSTTVAPTGWERWSAMARPDGLFDWGIVVRQNAPDTKRGAGSCVFLHIWRGPQKPTAGCTAMAKDRLLEILRWLDPEQHPLLVQLPDEAFRTVQSPWGLPNADG
jgi:D-alanyl-D-alanine dipeptidase